MDATANPYESPQGTAEGLAKRTILQKTVGLIGLVLPLLVPTAFYFLYQPINEGWTVRHFGCGCPNLDGSPRFDANDFNLILMAILCLMCSAGWVVSCARQLPQNIRSVVCLPGIVFIVQTSVFAYGRMIWL